MAFIKFGTDKTENPPVRRPAPPKIIAGNTDSGGPMIDGARFGFGTAFGVALGLFTGGVLIHKIKGA
jgi:hypothetical protein